jgi:hypothetical protein
MRSFLAPKHFPPTHNNIVLKAEMVLDQSIPTPSQYNSIRHFDEQVHSILPERLRDIGNILVKHVMHSNFGVSLLHRHIRLQKDCVMVYSIIDSNINIYKMEFLKEHKDLSPYSFYLTTGQLF